MKLSRIEAAIFQEKQVNIVAADALCRHDISSNDMGICRLNIPFTEDNQRYAHIFI